MIDSTLKTALQARLEAVEQRLLAACTRSGRPRSAVTVVAVTKTVSVAVAAAIAELGVKNLGENRPQELWHKAAELPNVRWHLIGHLQRNKIARTLPLVELIHSVDSLRLLEAVDESASQRASPLPALLEINVSRESSKGGFAPEELPALLPKLNALRHVRIEGLMTMAALEDDPERCRPTFRALHELRECLASDLEPPHRLEQLSMGMTNDFEIAVEEGATLVRLGTVLFEGMEQGKK